jgi:hypothetical protein
MGIGGNDDMFFVTYPIFQQKKKWGNCRCKQDLFFTLYFRPGQQHPEKEKKGKTIKYILEDILGLYLKNINMQALKEK